MTARPPERSGGLHYSHSLLESLPHMNHAATTKIVGITPPAAFVDNAAFTTAALDTKGFNRATIYVYLGATDIAFAGLKVQESEASDMTGAVDVTGLVFGTSADHYTGETSAVPSATNDNKIFAFDVDLNGRMRYLDVVATGGDGTSGTYAVIWAELSRPNEFPDSAADRGLQSVLAA